MALSLPLAIAVVAMVLLVGSVTVEVAFQRSYVVQAHDATGWQTIGQAPIDASKPTVRAPAQRTIVVSHNGSVEFRLRLDNGMLWSASENYDVIVGGASVADGTLAAPARGVGESLFTIPVATLVGPSDPGGAPTKEGPAANVTFVNLDVEVGSRQVYANFQLQEAK